MCLLWSGSVTGSRSARLEPPQPPSAERRAAAEKQQSAAAAVDKCADQILLRRREIARLHRADDQRLIAEKIFGARGKAVGEFLRILDALAIDFVFGGAQHGNDLRRPVVLLRAADEFVFPARLAFDVEDAALVVDSTFTSRVTALLARFASPGSGSIENCSVFAPASPALKRSVSVLGFAVRRQMSIGCDGQNFVAVAHGQRGLLPGVAALVESDLGGEPRIRQRARRNDGVVDFHVVRDLLRRRSRRCAPECAGCAARKSCRDRCRRNCRRRR